MPQNPLNVNMASMGGGAIPKPIQADIADQTITALPGSVVQVGSAGSAVTATIKASAGRVTFVQILSTTGSTAGVSLYDVATVGGIASSNNMAVVPGNAGASAEVNMPFFNGLSCSVASGVIVSIGFA